jgi:hypothetical protein
VIKDGVLKLRHETQIKYKLSGDMIMHFRIKQKSIEGEGPLYILDINNDAEQGIRMYASNNQLITPMLLRAPSGPRMIILRERRSLQKRMPGRMLSYGYLKAAMRSGLLREERRAIQDWCFRVMRFPKAGRARNGI